MDPILSRLDEDRLMDFLALIAWSVYGMLRLLLLIVLQLVRAALHAMEEPTEGPVEEPTSQSNRAANHPVLVPAQPAARPVLVRMADAFFDGRIEEGDARQAQAVKVAMDTALRREGGRRFYVVGVGRHPGVYLSPEECNRQIMGYSGNKARTILWFAD